MSQAADDIIDLYERHAESYDRDRGRGLMEREWLAAFREAAGPDAAILDLGCGCGEPIARHLIESGHPLTGVDSSAGLIALCRKRFPDGDWRVADMRRLNLGRRFGGILAWDSFFHLTPADQRAIFAVFQDHAAPGAALMFTSGPAAGEAMGEYQGDALYHASLDKAEYEDLLARHGFQVRRHMADDPDCGGHTVWLARFEGVDQKA
jgi:trans-aconitate methyltransferase